MQNISTVTELSFAKSWSISSTLILPRSSMWKSVKNLNRATFQICDPLYENRTYEAILNLEKGPKINIVSNMACHSTVSLKPFASKRCFYLCQQNLVVQLYYGCTTGFENLVAFPLATMKLQTVKCGSSIKN